MPRFSVILVVFDVRYYEITFKYKDTKLVYNNNFLSKVCFPRDDGVWVKMGD